MEDINEYFIGMALGVRFRANFSIEDQMGSIVDTILYSKNSFFGPSIFPKVKGFLGSKILFNELTQNKIHIDNSNVILELNFTDEQGFRKDEADKITKMFEGQIIRNVMQQFKIREIVRIGYIKRYVYNIDNLANTFVNKTIGDTLGGINDINLSFSKKFTTVDGQIKQNVNDYDNAIFNIIKKADLDEIFMAIDFQRYFHPFLDNAGEIKLRQFIEKAEAFNSGNYLAWLNKNYLEAANV